MHRIFSNMLAVFIIASLAACDRTTAVSDTPTTLYGTPVAVGNGHVRTYVSFDDPNSGAPSELGVVFDEHALDGLPAPGADPSNPMNMYSYILPLPSNTPQPFQLMELDWNASGHVPAGVYDKPHFDFHFYSISLAERNAIMPSDPNFMAEASNFPPAPMVPPSYAVLPPAPAPVPAVPMMGVHWTNVTSPEVQPPTSPNHHDFTRTFIYGSWNGKFTFVEPMITLAYLQSHPDEHISISVPSSYAAPGFYPTAYRVSYDAATKETRVALSDLVLRQ